MVDLKIKLEKYDTRSIDDNHINGSLTVIWRDWDEIIQNSINMIYVSSVNPGESKGPHIHTKRHSHFVCMHGKVVFIIKEKNGNYLEIESSAENPVMVHIPKNCSSAHVNLSKNISRVLALADLAWHPNDDEMKNDSFDDYDWKKWK
jgi:dTDP-4-dehydrorhamnose 3,5-epimerase